MTGGVERHLRFDALLEIGTVGVLLPAPSERMEGSSAMRFDRSRRQ
jgi:hypothetical protein